MVSPVSGAEAQNPSGAHTNLYDVNNAVEYGLSPQLYIADQIVQAARKKYYGVPIETPTVTSIALVPETPAPATEQQVLPRLAVTYDALVENRNQGHVGWSGPGLCYGPYNPFQPLAPAA